MDAARSNKLELLIERALALPSEQRAAFLEQTCTDDLALRRELESLLELSQEAPDYLNRLSEKVVTPTMIALLGNSSDNLENRSDKLVGQRLSHYMILEKLGGGGMGVVYKARDTKLDRLVTLKFLPPHLSADATAKQRLITEARAASALDHPNIAVIHEIGETEEGQLFIVMAYYVGETLKKKVTSEQLSVDSVIDIAIQIAQGLAKAHEKGIIHRDIKPANVLLTNEGVAKIVDFGIAKMAGEELTKTGTPIGTVAYMSPEQTHGKAVDQRTDLWSLGVFLYEMLIGQQPFQRENEQAVIYAIRNDEPEPVKTLRPEVPPELATIVERCLKKDPARRYQQAQEIVTDLCQISAASQPSVVGTPSPKALTKEFLKKRLQVLAMPGIVLFVAAVIISGYFFMIKEAEPPKRLPVAVVDFVNETREEEMDGLSGMLITSLEQSRRLSVLTRARMFDILKQLGREEVDRIDEALGREICQQANVNALVLAAIRKFGQLYTIDLKVLDTRKNEYLFAAKEEGRNQEDIPAMIDRLSEKTRIGLNESPAEIQATSRNVATVMTANLEAYGHYFMGEQLLNQFRFIEAQDQFRKAIAIDSTFALAYYRLAYSAWVGTVTEEPSREIMQKAIALLDRLPERERFLARAHQAILEAPYRMEGLKAGLAILKEMEKIYPDDKEMLYNIGDLSFHLIEIPAKRMEYLEMAQDYLEKVLAIDPKFERALQHLTWTYNQMGRQEKMLETAERHVSVTATEESYRGLGNAYVQVGDLEMALQTLLRGRELFPRSPQGFLITDAIAECYIFQEEFDSAEAELKSLVAAHQPFAAKLNGHRRLSFFYVYLGKFRQAMRHYDKAIELYWQTKDTVRAVRQQVSKAFRIWEGWYDSTSAWQEIEKTLPFRNKKRSDFLWPWYRANLAALQAMMGNEALAENIAASRAASLPAGVYPFLLSFIHIARHECAQAQEFLTESVKKGAPEFTQNWLSFYLAQCYFETGRLDKAIELLKQVQESLKQVRVTSESSFGIRVVFFTKSLYLLGKIYEKKGDRKLAMESYEKLLELWKDADEDLPDLIEAQDRLAKLVRALSVSEVRYFMTFTCRPTPFAPSLPKSAIQNLW